MGAGKTYYGTLLNQEKGVNFLDTDKLLEKRFSLTISEYFALYGESAFRIEEGRLLAELDAIASESLTVIAAGGGVVTVEQNRKQIQASTALKIYLYRSWDILYERIKDTNRPLVTNVKKEELFKLWFKRHHWYKQVADIVWTGDKVEELWGIIQNGK